MKTLTLAAGLAVTQVTLLQLGAGAQSQQKANPSTPSQDPIIRSVSHHEPIDPHDIAMGVQANLADIRGQNLLEQGAPTAALAAFHEALVYDPHDGLAFVGQAKAYTALGETAKAIDSYRTLYYDWPGKGWGDGTGNDTRDLMHFTELLLQTGQRGEALSVYRRGVQRLPADTGPLPPLFETPDVSPSLFEAAIDTAIGIKVHTAGEQNQALATIYFQKALALEPDLPQPYYYLGQIAKFKDGHDQEAVDDFSRASELGGPDMQPFLAKAAKEGTLEFTAAAKEAKLGVQQ